MLYGFDGGKKVKGRKRHLVADLQGLLIGALVSEANASERLGAIVVFDQAQERLARLEVVWVDQGRAIWIRTSLRQFDKSVESKCTSK